MSLTLQATNVFYRNLEAFQDPSIRFILNQGGSRSSKTWSIIQLLFVQAAQNANTKISVVRKFKSSLNKSFLADFKEFLSSVSSTDLFEIKFGGDLVEFKNGSIIQMLGVDDPQKIRGVKHDIVFINEANELSFEDFNQLNFRTERKLILDFNPSEDETHWIYGLINQANSTLIRSTYKDNPFLPAAQALELERLIEVDENYYSVYVLGMPPKKLDNVFSTFELAPFPADIDFSYGCDFGYSDPHTLVQVAIKDKNLYLKEVIYQTHLNIDQVIELMKALGVSTTKKIHCDSARPDLIETMRRAGFNVLKANKAIKAGLDKMRTHKIYIDPESRNLLKEFRNYRWKKRGEKILDEPEGGMDHAIDAARYATMGSQTGGPIRIYSFET